MIDFRNPRNELTVPLRAKRKYLQYPIVPTASPAPPLAKSNPTRLPSLIALR
jgi:hypothetical protein